MDRKCEECLYRCDRRASNGCLSLKVRTFAIWQAWEECKGRFFEPKPKPDRAARDLKEDLEFAETHTE